MTSKPFDGDIPGFDVVERQRIHDGFLKLDRYRVHQHLFDGGVTPVVLREVLVAHPAVAVLCYDPALDVVVLVEQARLPAALAGFRTVQTEIVAGLIEPGEPPEAVARREVLEETGLTVLGEPELIVHMVTTPGHSTEAVHLFAARVDAADAGGIHGVLAEHEDIRVVTLPAAEFARWIGDGRIANSFSIVAGFWLMLNRDRLRTQWSRLP